MSIASTERLHLGPNRLSVGTKAAAIALKNLVSPPYESPDSFNHVPLRAVSRVQALEIPADQLKQALDLREDVALADTESIDPVIDSASQRWHDELAEIDRRRNLDRNDPEYLEDTKGASYVNPRDVEIAFRAFDAHRSEPTQKLASFAARHAASKDLSETFTNAVNYQANNGQLTLMEALETVRSQPSSFEPNAKQYNDEYARVISTRTKASADKPIAEIGVDFGDDVTVEKALFPQSK